MGRIEKMQGQDKKNSRVRQEKCEGNKVEDEGRPSLFFRGS